MSDQVRIPEDRFSHNEAHIIVSRGAPARLAFEAEAALVLWGLKVKSIFMDFDNSVLQNNNMQTDD